MKFDLDSGLFSGVTNQPSPNCDARPLGEVIDLLVIHAISLPPGQFGGPYISDLFCNRLDGAAHPYFAEIHQMEVSAHLLVRRQGEVIQYVPLQLRAWHAGKSVFQGREGCNRFSIGIELEGCDDVPFEPVQYQVLVQLCREIMRAYPAITPDRIVGHSDIAPGRKTDPGPYFDWSHFRQLLAEAVA
ncbi:MAG: 1,6-anhydro-N-acetylmuramyl-L-alanine amidase AmpD [Gammaproteobacteria bacterium]|nr:1,6-anhydro-N-acetylmuramyl-L-alanine amidase AmpD [Gammaproteobacteria bacterium]